MRALALLVALLAPAAIAATCQPGNAAADGGHNFAASPGAPPLPPGTRIRSIHITRLPVFNESDPAENNAVYRLANRIHRTTGEQVLRRQLLLAEGQPYDRRLAEESARILRSRGYLYGADMRLLRLCDGWADLELAVRDIWSLNLEASFERAGGENLLSLGLSDSNILGSGAQLGVRRRDSLDGAIGSLFYRNRHLRGGRRLELGLERGDQGDGHILHLGRPHRSLDSRRSWSAASDGGAQLARRYHRARVVGQLRERRLAHSLQRGWSAGLRGGLVRRWSLSLGYETLAYRATASAPPLPPAAARPLRMLYAGLALHSMRPRFVRRINLMQMHRLEDVDTGSSLQLGAAIAPRALGSDASRLLFHLRHQNAPLSGGRHLLRHAWQLSGRHNLDDGRSENLQASYQARYWHRINARHSWALMLRAQWHKRPDGGRQIVLGGDTGARAFANRLQSGDRSLLLSLERRMVTDWHPLHLLRLGFAAFADFGRAWRPGAPRAFANRHLADIGIGLRLASSKADATTVVHLDWATPISNRSDPDVDDWLVAVRLRNYF